LERRHSGGSNPERQMPIPNNKNLIQHPKRDGVYSLQTAIAMSEPHLVLEVFLIILNKPNMVKMPRWLFLATPTPSDAHWQVCALPTYNFDIENRFALILLSTQTCLCFLKQQSKQLQKDVSSFTFYFRFFIWGQGCQIKHKYNINTET
jgi:hypothetical protein